ncbi:hypothetical protein Hanom_Chr06g00559341 [Helianthus anomalus]
MYLKLPVETSAEFLFNGGINLEFRGFLNGEGYFRLDSFLFSPVTCLFSAPKVFEISTNGLFKDFGPPKVLSLYCLISRPTASNSLIKLFFRPISSDLTVVLLSNETDLNGDIKLLDICFALDFPFGI